MTQRSRSERIGYRAKRDSVMVVVIVMMRTEFRHYVGTE